MNFWIKLKLLLFTFLVAGSLYAQEFETEDQLDRHHIYWNAGALIGFPSSVKIGYENKIAQKMTWDLQAGLIISPSTFVIFDRKGYSIETGPKWYIKDDKSLGLKLMYKNVNFIRSDWLLHQSRRFERQFDITTQRENFALFGEFGWIEKFSKNISIEFQIGSGLFLMKQSFENFPQDYLPNEGRGTIFNDEKNYLLPFLNYGFKLKFRI